MSTRNLPRAVSVASRTRRDASTPPSGVPPLSLQTILRRQSRAVAGLLFRLIALPILVTLLCRQAPGLHALRPVLEAGAGMLALIPFAVAWGRLAAARIALGRALTERADWKGANLVLTPFGSGGWTARLFDATGEGRYHLAQACRALGRRDAASRLLATLSRDIGVRSEWGRRAGEMETT